VDIRVNVDINTIISFIPNSLPFFLLVPLRQHYF
jgi:hypothetical protein